METILWLAALSFIVLLFRKWFRGVVCPCKNDLQGKVVVITGASSGIGKETALELGRRGARVLILCRKSQHASQTFAQLQTVSKDSQIVQLDLASKQSILECSKKVSQLVSQIDVLINNAGLTMPTQQLTEDGYETTLQANHLGHFYLTQLLFPLLQKSSSARIINVSSLAHRMIAQFPFGPVRFEEDMYVPGKVPFSKGSYYSQSKLANVLFTQELALRCQKKGNNITAYSLHPGLVYTPIVQKSLPPFLKVDILSELMKSSWLGAQTSIYLSVEDKARLQSGGYYDDCHLAQSNECAESSEDRLTLWRISQQFAAAKFQI